jgi:RNA polymerase sigma-70 factor (ECF subfamily)
MTDPPDNAPAGLDDALVRHRPELLRHCYRMLGSFGDAEDVVQEVLLRAWRARESWSRDVPALHWLMRIATNACLDALSRGRHRSLPQLDRPPAAPGTPIEELEAATWVTPAPDAQLLPGPDERVEEREAVALAFVALLQRLPPRQRAALLLKDVVGWSSEEIAEALATSVPAVSSALHRAREAVARPSPVPAEEPPAGVIQRYLRCWEERDLDGLVAHLKDDVIFAMPPHATWFRGAGAVRAFLQTPRFAAFWARGLHGLSTRANGLPALVWYVPADAGGHRLHSIHVMRFEGGVVAEAVNFIGEHYLRGFHVPRELPDDASCPEAAGDIGR